MDIRKAEVFTNNAWTEVPFEDIKEGQKFRLFEPTGEPVVNLRDNIVEWVALSDAYLNFGSVWTIDIE